MLARLLRGMDFGVPLIILMCWAPISPLFAASPVEAGGRGIHAARQEVSTEPPVTLNLERCIDLALSNNRNITSSLFRADSQEHSVTAAKSDFEVKVLPSVSTNFFMGNRNVGAGVLVKKKLETGGTISLIPSMNVTDQQYWNDLSLTIEQPLFRGFGEDVTLDPLRSAEFSKETAVRNIYQTKVNIGLEIITAYYNAVKQLEMRNLYEAMASRLKGHSAMAAAKGKVGLATPMETYRAEIRLKDAEDAATQASEAYLEALDRIKVILSLPLKTDIVLEPPPPLDFAPVELAQAVETALKNRIEMEQSQAELREAERKALVMKQNTLPGVNLVMSVGQYDIADSFGRAVSLSRNRWNVALQGSTDLQRTAEKAAYQQSLLNVKMLHLELEKRGEEIGKQVRKQWNAFREDEKRIRIRKEQMQQAREKLALAEVKYAHDMADNFDVIEAETELQRAKVTLLSAEMDYAVGTYNMKAMLGTLIPRN